jgi:hypothetical protein
MTIKITLIFLLFIISACSSAPPPNVEATVQAAVAATQAAQPTNTPTPKPTVTPVPTNTPAPTDTPASTSTPKPPTLTPTPSGPLMEILSLNDYVDRAGYLHIVGEVENLSDQQAFEFIKAIATLYDDSGNVVGSEYTYTLLEVLLPGEKSPFDITTNQFENTTRYEVQIDANPARTAPRTDLDILSTSDNIDDIGYWHVTGEVENTGSTPAQFIKVILTARDVNKEVVDVGYSYTSLDTIPPGGKSPFEISIVDNEDIDTYTVQVQGQ